MPTSVANDRAVFGTACASASCFSPQIDWRADAGQRLDRPHAVAPAEQREDAVGVLRRDGQLPGVGIEAAEHRRHRDLRQPVRRRRVAVPGRIACERGEVRKAHRVDALTSVHQRRGAELVVHDQHDRGPRRHGGSSSRDLLVLEDEIRDRRVEEEQREEEERHRREHREERARRGRGAVGGGGEHAERRCDRDRRDVRERAGLRQDEQREQARQRRDEHQVERVREPGRDRVHEELDEQEERGHAEGDRDREEHDLRCRSSHGRRRTPGFAPGCRAPAARAPEPRGRRDARRP